eukprot:4467099-Prymnesium_polylepis.4
MAPSPPEYGRRTSSRASSSSCRRRWRAATSRAGSRSTCAPAILGLGCRIRAGSRSTCAPARLGLGCRIRAGSRSTCAPHFQGDEY